MYSAILDFTGQQIQIVYASRARRGHSEARMGRAKSKIISAAINPYKSEQAHYAPTTTLNYDFWFKSVSEIDPRNAPWSRPKLKVDETNIIKHRP